MAAWRCPLCGGPERADGTLVCDPAYRGPAGHRHLVHGPEGPRRYEAREICWDCWCGISKARWASPLKSIDGRDLPVVVRGVR